MLRVALGGSRTNSPQRCAPHNAHRATASVLKLVRRRLSRHPPRPHGASAAETRRAVPVDVSAGRSPQPHQWQLSVRSAGRCGPEVRRTGIRLRREHGRRALDGEAANALEASRPAWRSGIDDQRRADRLGRSVSDPYDAGGASAAQVGEDPPFVASAARGGGSSSG